MAKDFKQGMAHGLASLTQNPTKEPAAVAVPDAEPQQAAEQTPEPKQEPKTPKRVRAYKTEQPKQAASITAGLRTGYTRATIIARQETLAKIREIAYLEREHTMDVVEAALADYVANYETENGKVKLPKPKKQRNQ